MAEQDDIILAFDLDGTIANYGQPVARGVADYLNTLGEIHIITGGAQEPTVKSCRRLKNKIIHAVRAWKGNKSIDVANIMGVTKNHFNRSMTCQLFRQNLCVALREAFHPEIYIGGRATIDIMPMRNKGHIIRKLQTKAKVVYFYDCRWRMNDKVNNDVPAITEAWKSIRTDHHNIIRDVKECLKTLNI